MKVAWLAGFLVLSNQCVSDQRTQDLLEQQHESLKVSSPNEKPFSVDSGKTPRAKTCESFAKVLRKAWKK